MHSVAPGMGAKHVGDDRASVAIIFYDGIQVALQQAGAVQMCEQIRLSARLGLCDATNSPRACL